jgi:hypothetical protein
LHFGYEEMLRMDVLTFGEFVKLSEEIIKAENGK